MQIIKVEKNDTGASFLLEKNDVKVWFDVWHDKDGYTGDWNKYIFYTNDTSDMEIKAFQEAHNNEIGAYNFSDALDTCIEYLENN